MNRVIGEISTQVESIIHGDHRIVTSIPLADGQTGIKAGMPAYVDSGKYKALKSTDLSGKQPVAIILEDVTGETSSNVVLAAVHGAVRADKLQFADAKPITAEAVAKLRLVGIYAIGDLPPTAGAPVIDTQPQAVTVAQNEPASLTVIAHAPDNGTLSYKWFKNGTNSASGGSAVDGGTNAVLTLDTSVQGTKYYYCEVTNTLGNTTAKTTSAVATVTINAGD